MDDRFLNPITASFEILENYRALVRQALVTAGLDEAGIEQIMRGVQVDRGLYLSLNRHFELGRTGFRQFCAGHGLSYRLPDLPELSRIQRLYVHQEEAILSILEGITTILATGTGSGKTEAFLIPILDHCLKHAGERGVKALIVYPMNALANDQCRRIKNALSKTDVTMGLFIGSENEDKRNAIRRDPPDILVTNYVMLDRMLTRGRDQAIFAASADSLRYIVLDEIHVYKGNLATHLRFLLVRLRERLAHPPICIGTSATLRHNADGDTADQAALDAFVRPLLNVDGYRLVRPHFEETDDPPELGRLMNTPSEDRRPRGWELRVDVPAGLRNLSLLTGENYSEMDMVCAGSSAGFDQTRLYRDMAHNPLVTRLRRRLQEGGATSFVDLVGLATTLLPQDCPASAAEDLLKSHLSGIAFLNHQAGEQCPPLLDFRVHLFLKNVGGFLKRCLHCNSYHTGDQEFCQECGFPLFCVYRYDTGWCVGKASGGRLRWTLAQESDDKKSTHYVLLARREALDERAGSLTFSGQVSESEDGLNLDYDAGGKLNLKPLPERNYEGILQCVIPLAPERRRFAYIHNLAATILDYEPHGRKKLLAFVDNRELASQYAQVMQDEFASRFFKEYLKLCYPVGRELDVVDTLDILHRKMPNQELLADREKELFDELDLWYHREIGTPPRFADGDATTLFIRDAAAYSEIELAVLEVFLTERAISWAFDDGEMQSRFVRFQKHWATDHRGIHLKPSEVSERPEYPSTSLGEHAQEHADLVDRLGLETIRQTVTFLVDRGVLGVNQTPDSKTQYAINPRHVCMRVSAGSCQDYEDLRERFLRTARAHTSEVKGEERELIEKAFQSGALNVVVATPTLELGIDIGRLQNVLLIGAPPSPANYAQRAGRAGRGQKRNFALIVSLCSEADDHDAYYFQRPALMINGVIAPPAFDPCNANVVGKHVNAWMLAGNADSGDDLTAFCRRQDEEIAGKLQTAERVFGPDSGAAQYLKHEFKSALNRQLASEAVRHTALPRENFYANGFFPDYSFRQDEVYLVDSEKAGAAATYDSPLRDIALSQREPELAYRKFAPGEMVFIGGGIYTVTSDGGFDTIHLNGGGVMRSYRYLVAEREERYAARDKQLRRYERANYFEHCQPFLSKGLVMGIAYSPDCRLIFANRGMRTRDGVQAFSGSDESEKFAIGYEVRRNALLMRFDRRVCADARAYISLVSALDRTIKQAYGLDESELTLLHGITPLKLMAQDDSSVYLAFSDAGGNGNVPMQRIFDDFDHLVAMTFQRLLDCQGSPGHPCGNGCYLCLRSHALRYLANKADKESALMFCGYLLGRNRFQPSIKPPKPPVAPPDLVLCVSRRGDAVVVASPSQTYMGQVGEGSQNGIIFELMSKAVQAEFKPAMRSLLVQTPLDYLVTALNEGAVKQGRDEFSQLQFNLLRFTSVRGVKA